MDEHTLTVLEYPELLAHLSRCAQSAPGAAGALALRPAPAREHAAAELAVTAEGLRLLVEGPPDLSMVRDTTGELARLGMAGAVLSPAELLALHDNQRGAREAQKAVRGKRRGREEQDGRSLHPLLSARAAELVSLPEWEEWVGASLTADGEVKDSASPALAHARRALREAREAVSARLSEFMRTDRVGKVLREDYVTMRNGRFVIPVKPEYQRAFKAVVQDSSASGQTVFVEPLFAVPLNNRLIEAQAAEQEELRRVLAEMSEVARSHRDGMARNLGILADLDLVMARARLGDKLSGTIPVLAGEGTRLVAARHPLLELGDKGGCVPVDLSLEGDTTALVITGPNTGGKTVALKTLGMLTLMAQSGIPVPAGEGSRFAAYRRVFADIGDEQSISQSLSTFSAHMSVLARVMEQADDSTLVLVDELGAGTDPQEGSALAVAIIEELHRKGARVAVTTHHNLLKEFAYRTPFAANASVVFDHATLRPTFQLRMGTPGRSHALEIAQGIGVQAHVVERARALMGSGAKSVDALIERLSIEVEREAAARVAAESFSREVERESSRLSEDLARALGETRQVRADTQREARLLLRDLRAKGKALIRAARTGEIKTTARLAEALAELEKTVERVFPPSPSAAGTGIGPAAGIAVGQAVSVPHLGMSGRVEKLHVAKKEAEVSSGALRVRVALSALEPEGPEEGDKAGPSAIAPRQRSGGGTAYQGESGGSPELMLLGMKVEEALEALDRFLDRHVLGPDRTLRVVHGTGTGALRKAVRAELARDRRVAGSRAGEAGEGGNGVTMVELRG
jgi:DNA mismatch repair protein MutS2